MLSSKLQEHGVKTLHAESDAYLLIVQTAVDSGANSATTVVGEDTDLLVLLCLHADVKSQPLLRWPRRVKHKQKRKRKQKKETQIKKKKTQIKKRKRKQKIKIANKKKVITNKK